MTVTMNTERKESLMAHAEIIEASVGIFHRWQLFVCLLVFLVNTPLAWQELAIVFLASPVSYNCSVSGVDKCSSKCPSRVYDPSIFTSTIVSEWDLVCDRAWLSEFSQTVLMAGVLVGNFGFGLLSDRFGRRKPLIIAVIIEVFAGIVVAFVPTLWLFMVFRFLVAAAAGGTLCTAFVITVEIVGRKYRSTAGILFQMTYYIGHSLLGGLAYFIRDWRHLQLTISVPVVVLVIYYWLLPESPRWLLTVGRLEEAIAVMEKGARINKMPTDHIRNNVMSKLENVTPLKENFFDLFRNPNVRMKTLCICFNWIVLGLSFFGVAQYMGLIGGNVFVNVASAGLIQIPGNIIIIFVLKKGRKITLMLTYLICGVSCLLIPVVPTEPTWIITLLGSLGMMGISLSFATMFVFSGELYPTVVRNVGMGTSAMCAKFGSMVAPFVEHLRHTQFWIPPLIFGIAPLLALLVSLKLPETLDTKMPDTVEEAEAFGKKVQTTSN